MEWREEASQRGYGLFLSQSDIAQMEFGSQIPLYLALSFYLSFSFSLAKKEEQERSERRERSNDKETEREKIASCMLLLLKIC